MPGARVAPGRVMSMEDLGAAGAAVVSARAASICCFSSLKRIPRARRASAGAVLSHASLMSLRWPCLRPKPAEMEGFARFVGAQSGGFLAHLIAECGEVVGEAGLVVAGELRDYVSRIFGGHKVIKGQLPD